MRPKHCRPMSASSRKTAAFFPQTEHPLITPRLIWTTWFVTGLYDVRFVTDSVFERCTRAVHLGVLMGFITVSPNFDPSDQDPRVFQTFCTSQLAGFEI